MTDNDIDSLIKQTKTSSWFTAVLVVVSLCLFFSSIFYGKSIIELVTSENQAQKFELQNVLNEVKKTTKPVSSTENTEGWLYVGRLTRDAKWAPVSQGTVPFPNAEQADFDSVKILSDSTIYKSAPNDQPSTASPSAPASAGPILLVKQNTVLKVEKKWLQPSIGEANYVWVKVSIAPQYLLMSPTSN